MDPHIISTTAGKWPLDWIIFGAIIIALLADSMRSGANRVTALAVSLPSAAWLASLLPQTFLVGPIVTANTTPLVQAAVFGVVFVVLFLLFQRILAMSFGISVPLVHSLLLGVLGAIIISVVWMQVPVLSALWMPGALMQLIFGEAYRFYWIVVVYVALAFVRS